MGTSTKIFALSLILLASGCNYSNLKTKDSYIELNDSVNSLSKNFNTLIQAYDEQKKDIKYLNDGILNLFKPYCYHHKGLLAVYTHSSPLNYPFTIQCLDGYTRKLNANNI